MLQGSEVEAASPKSQGWHDLHGIYPLMDLLRFESQLSATANCQKDTFVKLLRCMRVYFVAHLKDGFLGSGTIVLRFLLSRLITTAQLGISQLKHTSKDE